MKAIDKLVKTVAKLRSPKGCPWDKEQTHKTLKRYLIEEAYEALDAIDKNDSNELMEELGDVLLQIVLHAEIANEKKRFNLNDIANHINKKMISRHPHVFSNVKVKDSEEVIKNWEIIKKGEKPKRKSIFDGIPKALPALLKALKVSKKASRAGFEWEKEEDIWKTLESEILEFKKARKQKNKIRLSEEIGDILFTAVNIARWHKLDPEEALNSGTKKFIKRYNGVNKLIQKGNNNKKLSSKELEKLWKKIKLNERK